MSEKKYIEPPKLDMYMEEKKRRYVSYEEGAIMYSLPYWTFVNFAKEAKATRALRKTAIVDLVKLDKYMEEQCT